MMKFIVEGFSKDSMNDALAEAFSQAQAYFSEEHDVNIAILELTILPGRGYKAVLEVTIIPMTLHDSFQRESEDVERMRMHDKDYRQSRKAEEQRKKQMIQDYFSRSLGNLRPDIPDYFLALMNDAYLLNRSIEKNYLGQKPKILKTHPDIPDTEPDVPDLKKVLGKSVGPVPEPG